MWCICCIFCVYLLYLQATVHGENLTVSSAKFVPQSSICICAGCICVVYLLYLCCLFVLFVLCICCIRGKQSMAWRRSNCKICQVCSSVYNLYSCVCCICVVYLLHLCCVFVWFVLCICFFSSGNSPQRRSNCKLCQVCSSVCNLFWSFPAGVYTKTNLASKWVSKKNREKTNYKHSILHSDWLMIQISSIFVYLEQKDTTIWEVFGGEANIILVENHSQRYHSPHKNSSWNLEVFGFIWWLILINSSEIKLHLTTCIIDG